MGFRNNSVLITSATEVAVIANGIADVYDAGGGSHAYVIASGKVGNDSFVNFGSDDTILNGKKIFDGNGDGFIAFGPNGVLDIDRSSRSNAGEDHFQIVGENENAILLLRYLGEKGGNHAYADAGTLFTLFDTFGEANVIEGDVSNDIIDVSGGQKVVFHDNGLGLNLGSDTVTGFGDDDLFVTTRKLFDRDGDNNVTFGGNAVLDTSGTTGPSPSDPSKGPGGQVNFTGITGLAYLGSSDVDGTTYYYYGTATTTVDPII